LAQEIVKQTEKYLANGEYQELKLFAAQMSTGVVLGGGMAVKDIAREAMKRGGKASLGGLSKLLMGTKQIIMKPMLEGGQTGAAGSRFLSADELMRRLNVTKEAFHEYKKDILKDFPELRKKGINNPDIGTDGLGNIIFKDPKTGRTYATDVPLNNFIYLD
jgi:hypothetical protein